MIRCLSVISMVFVMTPLLVADETKAALPIGLIDVGHIFKNYKPAAEKLAALKPALKELEQTVQLRQVEIEQVQRRLAAPKEGDDVAKLRAQFGKLQQDLRVYLQTEQQKLQKRELEIQAEIYKLVQVEVRRIAKERGLKLVAVRPRGNLESQDAGELSRTLNQLVIFEDGLDLTDEVLKILNEKAAQETEGDKAKDDSKE